MLVGLVRVVIVLQNNFSLKNHFEGVLGGSFEKMMVTLVLTMLRTHANLRFSNNASLHSKYCVKSACIRSYSAFVFSPNVGKMKSRITPNTDTFHIVEACKKTTKLQPCFLSKIFCESRRFENRSEG